MGDTSEDELTDALVDVVMAVWAADEYNSICPANPISMPISEEDLRRDLFEATGSDLVGELAITPFVGDMDLKEHSKAIVRGYVEDGCDSELGELKRKEIMEDLAKIKYLYEDE